MSRPRDPVAARRRLLHVGCLTACAVVLLWPAIDNGYLFFNIDTGRHLGLGRNFSPAYPPFYNLWLIPLYALNLPWLVGLLQAGLAVGLIAAALRYVVRTRGVAAPALTTLALAAGTYLPFVASTALPDALTAVGLLAIVLAPQSPKPWRMPLAFVALGAAMVHYSHLPIYAAALFVGVALHGLRRGRAFRFGRFREAAVALALALSFHTLIHLAFYGRAQYSLSGPVFLLARLQQDGPAVWFLRRECPSPDYRLCAVLDQLPMPSDDFLWTETAPLNQLGNFQRLSDEASRVVAGAIRAYPRQTAQLFLRNTVEQLTMVRDFPSPTSRNAWMLKVAASYPPILAALEGAKQYGEGYRLPQLGEAHVRVMAACALLLVPLAALAWRRRQTQSAAIFALSLAAGYLANALVTGGVSRPLERYSARAAWLIPLAALIVALALVRQMRQSRARG